MSDTKGDSSSDFRNALEQNEQDAAHVLLQRLIRLHNRTIQQDSVRDDHAKKTLDDKAWKGLADFLTRVKLETVGRDVTVGQLVGLDDCCLSEALEGDDADTLQVWMTHANEQNEQLASMQAFFNQLNVHTQALQRSLKERMVTVSSKIGYANLPNELLLRIFHHVDGISTERTRQNVSLVCRRFRDLIQNGPEFWSELDTSMSADIVDLHLSRSKDVGLSISIWIHENSGTETIEFIHKVICNCHRWKYLKFKLDPVEELTDISFVEEISETLQELKLPLLQEITVLRGMMWEVSGNGNLGLDFYTTWDAPLLETAEFVNMFPMTNKTFALKSITIDYDEYDDCQTADWTSLELAEYLSEQPSVETLRLLIRCGVDFEQDDLTEHFSVPTLRTLQFSRGLGAPLETITPILHSLKAPALETLELCIVDKQLKTSDITSLFSHGTYSNLTNLSLLIRDYRSPYPTFQPLTSIFSAMPNLQHIKLECPDYPMNLTLPYHAPTLIHDVGGKHHLFPTPQTSANMPLRTIHLSHCASARCNEITGLVRELEAAWDWKNLETIRVSNYPRYTPWSNQWEEVLAQGKLLLE